MWKSGDRIKNYLRINYSLAGQTDRHKQSKVNLPPSTLWNFKDDSGSFKICETNNKVFKFDVSL